VRSPVPICELDERGMKLVKITFQNSAFLQDRVAELESIATYPLGDDFFKIKHGPDYFAFFRRLGELHYFALLDGDQVAAVGAGVLREQPVRAWYMCDLKVHPDYRGRHLPLRMMRSLFLRHYLKCRRGYAISMNDPHQDSNRIEKLFKKFWWALFHSGGKLLLFSLNAEEMFQAEPLLREFRGTLSYLSLRGKKEIVLQSTGEPMPLLHVQFGPCAEQGGFTTPQPGHTHMFCVPERDELSEELLVRGFQPSATATIIHHGMKNVDWSFVLTSDI